MNQIIDHSVSSIAVIVAGIFGSRFTTFMADAVSEVVNTPIPGWMAGLQGPFGALVGLAVGLVWMSKRLSAAEAKADEKERRAEEKADKRDAERDADRNRQTIVIEQNNMLLRDSNDLMRDVKTHLNK